LYVEGKKQPKKNDSNINDILEMLDELLLVSNEDALFGVVSLLRLLLRYDVIWKRYKDLTVLNQVVHRTQLPFLDEDDVEEDDNDNNNDKFEKLFVVPQIQPQSTVSQNNNDNKNNDNNDNDDNDNKQENVQNIPTPNIILLQFTTLYAISNVFKEKIVNVSNNVLLLSINALKIKNTNVRLASACLLFNISLQLRNQYILSSNKNDSNDDNNANDDTSGYNKENLQKIEKQINYIIAMICYFLHSENHLPTRRRLLLTLGVLLYCNEERDKNIQISLDAWSKKRI